MGNDELVHFDTMLAGLAGRIDEVESEIARLDGRVAVLRRERSTLVHERGALNQKAHDARDRAHPRPPDA